MDPSLIVNGFQIVRFFFAVVPDFGLPFSRLLYPQIVLRPRLQLNSASFTLCHFGDS